MLCPKSPSLKSVGHTSFHIIPLEVIISVVRVGINILKNLCQKKNLPRDILVSVFRLLDPLS